MTGWSRLLFRVIVVVVATVLATVVAFWLGDREDTADDAVERPSVLEERP